MVFQPHSIPIHTRSYKQIKFPSCLMQGLCVSTANNMVGMLLSASATGYAITNFLLLDFHSIKKIKNYWQILLFKTTFLDDGTFSIRNFQGNLCEIVWSLHSCRYHYMRLFKSPKSLTPYIAMKGACNKLE